MLRALTRTHSLPRFEGQESRRHADVPIWRLLARAARETARAPRRFDRVERVLNFAGFPRSGHSLIGAMLDAHPDALVSHELDAAGLFQRRVPARLIYALIAHNAAAFEAHGRWWNGFRYAVPAADPKAGQPRLIGDKKGDWAARRFAEDAGLPDRIARAVGVPSHWVLVVRHPLDNIATMSLRTSREFDRLRIHHKGGDFKARLEEAQREGRIPDHAIDAMIDDYAGLCAAVDGMAGIVPPDRWFEIGYEAFVADPATRLRALLAFLGLAAEDNYVASAAAIVRPSGSRSRDLVAWRHDQLDQVGALIARFPFLRRIYD